MRAPTEPVLASLPLSTADSGDHVPVSGLAAREGAASNDTELSSDSEPSSEEERVPSTKPSIVPGPMVEAAIEIRTSVPPVEAAQLGTRPPVASFRAFGCSVGVALVCAPVVLSQWARTIGVLCAAVGGALFVVSLLAKGGGKTP